MKIQREITYAERNRLIQAEERIDEEISRVLGQVIHQAAYEQSQGDAGSSIALSKTFHYHAERIPMISIFIRRRNCRALAGYCRAGITGK